MSQSSEQFLEQREHEEYGLLRETTKLQRTEFIQDVLNKMEEGVIDPLKIHLQVKGTESLISLLLDKDKNPAFAKRYRELVVNAAEKYGSKTFEMHNATMQVTEAGHVYDYSKCNDTEIIELHAILKAVKADVKTREDFLKSIPASGQQILTKDGEVVTAYPPSKSSTTIVKVTLK